ncbi:MAG: DNA polymerase-3 subunit delta [Methylophilaceae bacterium]|jgi:DNA polymerase-3 subunit delta|tara:strand:- start:61654 stop:62670 length:1017 start_codon:yes stop_codon:yes gene_type:complete
MQLAQAQLQQHLNKTLSPIYVLMGDEPLGQSECLDAIRQAARKDGAEERTNFIIERNFNWQSIQQFGQALSLFASKRMLEISIPNGKPGVEGGKALAALAENIIPDTTTIIILPTLAREVKKSIWFSKLQSAATVIELNDIAPTQLPQWIAKRLAQQNQSADNASLEFMAHQVEGNLLAAHQEIQKLGLLYPEGEISAEDIQAGVLNVSRYDAFKLGEAVLAGNPERTSRILQGLQDEGEQPVAVMNPLIWVLRPLVRVKRAQANGESINSAMTSARIYGNRQQQTKDALSRLSLPQLEAALQKLCDIDRIAKGIMVGNAWLELSRLCFGLARIRSRR